MGVSCMERDMTRGDNRLVNEFNHDIVFPENSVDRCLLPKMYFFKSQYILNQNQTRKTKKKVVDHIAIFITFLIYDPNLHFFQLVVKNYSISTFFPKLTISFAYSNDLWCFSENKNMTKLV